MCAAHRKRDDVIPLKDDTPLDRTPVVTILLIALNALVFLWQIDASALAAVAAAGEDVLGFAQARLSESVQRGGAIPYEILTFTDIDLPDIVPPPLTIFTSMFMHGGIGHIATNMLFLWIFGNNVEDALGRVRFVGFYLASGVAAALAQTVVSAASGDVLVPMVGASGAIAGVLAAYLVMFPHARVLTLVIVIFYIRFIPVPAGFFIGIWFLMQVLAVVFGGSPGVAVVAHVGGFVAGYLLVRVMGRRPTWRARRISW
jgi:membrane associated rhomboid family serine protease